MLLASDAGPLHPHWGGAVGGNGRTHQSSPSPAALRRPQSAPSAPPPPPAAGTVSSLPSIGPPAAPLGPAPARRLTRAHTPLSTAMPLRQTCPHQPPTAPVAVHSYSRSAVSYFPKRSTGACTAREAGCDAHTGSYQLGYRWVCTGEHSPPPPLPVAAAAAQVQARARARVPVRVRARRR